MSVVDVKLTSAQQAAVDMACGQLRRGEIGAISATPGPARLYDRIAKAEGSLDELEGARRPALLSANLGYCLTAHKAQGSEWPVVVVYIDPGIRTRTIDGRRWLYTAITRAQQQALICYL